MLKEAEDLDLHKQERDQRRKESLVGSAISQSGLYRHPILCPATTVHWRIIL
jgi:hypothetical protein